MDDKDTTLIPDNDSSLLAGKLQRIADYERGRRKSVPRVIRSIWRTRAYAAFYRWYGPKADPWLYRKTQGRGATARFPDPAPYYHGCQVGIAAADAPDLRARRG